MYEAAASCKDIARTPTINWETHGVTLAGYGYAVRQGMKVQVVTPYRVSHLQRYGVTVRGNVRSVHQPLHDDYDSILLSSFDKEKCCRLKVVQEIKTHVLS